MVELDQQQIEDANLVLRIMTENFEVFNPQLPSLSHAEFGHIATLFYGKETEAMESEQSRRVKKALSFLGCISYLGKGCGYHRMFDGYEEPEKCIGCPLADNCDLQNGNIDPFEYTNDEEPLNNFSNTNIKYLQLVFDSPKRSINPIENIKKSSISLNADETIPKKRKPRYLTDEQITRFSHEISELVNKGLSLRKSCAIVRKKYGIKYTIGGLKAAFKDLITPHLLTGEP